MAKSKNKAKTSNPNVKVHLPQMMMLDELSEHPRNSNKQSKHVSDELEESILEKGFDESLIVAPRTDGKPGYWIISGNHRYRAAKKIGLMELPVVVRDDWDSVQQQVELVRRNYIRGSIDKLAFTEAVNLLSEESQMDISEIVEEMGFPDVDEFSLLYQSPAGDAVEARVKKIKEEQGKLLDEISVVVQHILEEYGDTLLHSFMLFPTGGKNHLYVKNTNTLKKLLQQICLKCIKDGVDLNVVLGGLIQKGVESTGFLKRNSDNAFLEEVKEEDEKEPLDDNFELIK